MVRSSIMLMSKRIFITAVAIVTICASGVFAATLVHAGLSSSEELSSDIPVASTTKQLSHSSGDGPLRISIPAINVDAKVQSVGIAKSGNMAVPTNYTDVGWYRYGPLPGELGSAVIDGHVDNGFALAAVFKQLQDLTPGEDIFVTLKDGSQKHFIVETVAAYPVAEVPLKTLFDRADKPRLNLITCTGTWDSSKKAYDQRIVVYATLAQ
jgi:sortase A